MRTFSRLAASTAAALTLIGIATSCSEPTRPAPAASASPNSSSSILGLPLLTGTPLKRTVSLALPESASVTLSPWASNTLQLPNAGLRVVFPAGAVSQAVTVWVKARAGDRVVYGFGPHGLRFNVPILIEQDLRNTVANGNLLVALGLRGGYVLDENEILADGSMLVAEVFDVALTLDLLRLPRYASFRTSHFSGYILASGLAE